MEINGTNSDNYLRYCPSYNATQINISKPTANVPAQSVVYDYPNAGGQLYYPPVQTNPVPFGERSIHIPSGVEDYNNYIEVDTTGNEVANVQYSKNGDTLIQNLRTKSPDGTVLEKTLTNSPDLKTSVINITDKAGNVIFTKNKSYKKIDDNTAQTTLNGEVYNISGLKGDIITVEHNGQSINIDLNKMLKPDVKTLKSVTSPDNLPIRDNKITNEEKQKLFNRIKSLSGDDLVRLSKSVEHIQFLDDKSIESFFVESDKTLLLSPKDWENKHLVTEHELGHAITYTHSKDNKTSILSDNESFKNVRAYEKENFKNNKSDTVGDKMFGSKFMFGNSDLAWSNGDEDGEEANLRNETFAECYNNLNNMDIIHYEDEVLPSRTLSLFKYLPKTMIEADKLSHIEK